MQFFKNDRNFSWSVLTIESLVIMLSVFLGFMLNSWRLSQRQQADIDTALRSITAEMQHNKQQLEGHLPHYRAMVDTLNYLASKQGENVPIKINEIPGGRGFSIPILRRSAFETARSTGALSHMKFELANHLFAYYRFQSLYSGLIDKLLNGLITNNYKTIRDWQMVFSLMKNNGEYIHAKRFNDLLNRLSDKYDMATTQTDSTNAARRKP